MLVANLWAKQLIAGDRIVKAEWHEHPRYGPIKRFTVERTEEAHAAEEERQRLADLEEADE